MRLKDYDPNGLSQFDKEVYEEAIILSRDCNRWLDVYDLAGRVQSSTLKTMILHTSNVMKNTLDYYEENELGE